MSTPSAIFRRHLATNKVRGLTGISKESAFAARHARQALKDDGTVLLVEPFAGSSLAENSTPVGRLYYAASSMVCTPNSLSQEVGLGLGAQAGEARLREVFAEAGFSRFRRATETPFNLILEARK